ncbi:hypothetical protein I4F81_010862 [Pyropia yezoensis]|uniref:Uncharacterized protein n=1 Tax=Pyropia yezoensis TaxID=2788 RepID=A0ACC3CE62_PYRYE|nr:hypothetical protein I4F81_010862 [Neopyropia yezoensis]
MQGVAAAAANPPAAAAAGRHAVPRSVPPPPPPRGRSVARQAVVGSLPILNHPSMGAMVSVMRARQLLAATAFAAAALSGVAGPAAAATQWQYYGRSGPAFWGELDTAWRKCDSGRQQTPIDLVPLGNVANRDLRSVATQKTAAFLPKAVQNGFKYDCVSTSGCGSAFWSGVKYDLLQFHLHVAAEHTLDGAVIPGELHLVHATSSGRLLVVGVLIDVGAPSPLITKMLAGAEKAVISTDPKPFARLPISKAEWASVLPLDRGFCNYMGWYPKARAGVRGR